MKMLLAGVLLLIALLMTAGASRAQWPDDPAVNSVVSNGNGAQVTPIAAATSDGGCYVLFYNHASGNYDVYLQKIDPDGNVLWGNGLLVSDHAMTSYTTEWDFAVDADDNAIIATNDIRNGPDWDIYGYSIAPDGSFNWGPDGLALSSDALSDVAQQIMVASNGDIVFAWQSDNDIALRRVDSDGNDVWDPATIYISSTYAVTIPRMAPADDGGFLLQFVVSQGSQYWSPRWLYIQRYNSAGEELWNPGGVLINNTGGIGVQMRPDIVNDGGNGAISWWYDSHESGQLHTYVQHINNLGAVQWPDNGVKASLANELQMSPKLAWDQPNGYIYVFYETADLGQTTHGLGAQMFDLNGNRQWDDNGVALMSLATWQQFQLQASLIPDGGAVVSYLEYQPGDYFNALAKAIRIDDSGVQVWPTSPMTLSSVVSPKGYNSATVNPFGQVIDVWSDQRNDPDGDVYLQNVNPDGSLGPLQQPDPIYVELLNPNPLVIPPGGATIHYDVHVVNSTLTTYPNVHYWTNVILPNGNAVGPLFNQTFTLAAGMDVTVAGPAQNIPAAAPAGNYTFFGQVGFLAGPFVFDSFDFQKTAVAAHGIANWDSSGEFAITGVSDRPAALPHEFALNPARPNPFNPATTLSVALPRDADLNLTVVNTLGRQVAVLANGRLAAGTHSFVFDGSSLASGVYLARATVPGELNSVRKIVLIK